MTEIKIYDTCAEKIEEIAEKNDSTVAEVVEALLEFEDEMKDNEGWV